MSKISLDEKFALFSEYWRPKTIAAAGTINTGNVKDAAYTADREVI